MTRFAWNMAVREMRAHWSRFVFFLVSVALGVGALIAVDLVSKNVARAIHHDAKSLLGGEVVVTLSHPLSTSGLQVLASVNARGAEVLHVRELVAMAAHPKVGEQSEAIIPSPRLVEVKAVPKEYPLFGTIVVTPTQTLPQALARQSGCERTSCYGTVVEESLLYHLQVEIGTVITVGQVGLKITGVLLREPDRIATAFRLGPRMMISHEALAASKLIQPGSRIREKYLLRLPPGTSVDSLVKELRRGLASEGARIVTYQNAQPRVRRFLDQLTMYLGLIGLTALVVAGIGITCTIHGHLARKMLDIAVLKTLGADSATIIKVYLLHSVMIGGLGSLAGLAMGIGIQASISGLVERFLSFSIPLAISWSSLAKGMGIGLISSIASTLWPLLAIRHISPALVLRRTVESSNAVDESPGRPSIVGWCAMILRDRPRSIVSLILGVAFIGLGVWQAGSWLLGMWVAVAMVAALATLTLLATGLVKGLFRLPMPRSLTIRHALRNLARPGSYTTGTIVAIGMSVMIMTGMMFSQHALVTALVDRIPTTAPTFFFIDIQPDQRGQFERVLREHHVVDGQFQITPVVRSRLVAINGQAIDPETRDKRHRWYFTREYVLAALADLPEGNAIVQGSWWNKESEAHVDDSLETSQGLVSVEANAAKHLNVGLGDTLTFDMQGMPFSVKVVSLRTVDWGSLNTNFFMILSPGSLANAPVTYLASAHVDQDHEAPLQRALVTALPNITAIKVGDVLQQVIMLIQRIAWAAEGLAVLCLLNGVLVMATALSSTWYRRIVESAILKVLGATRGMTLRIFSVEFLVMGVLAGLVGIAMAAILSWVIVHHFLDIPWTFDARIGGLAVGLTALLALILGLSGAFRLLAAPPLRILREE